MCAQIGILMRKWALVKIIVLWWCILYCITMTFLDSDRKISWRGKCCSGLNILNHAVTLVRRNLGRWSVNSPAWDNSPPWIQTGLCRALFAWVLKTPEDRGSTAPLGTLWSVILVGFFLLVQCTAMHRPVCLGNLLEDIGRLLLGAPQASSSQG